MDSSAAQVLGSPSSVPTKLMEGLQKGGADATKDIDTFFLLMSAYIVVFMQAGFGLLSAGSVRAKNTKAILLKILLNTAVAGACYYIVGFALAFGGEFDDGVGSNSFIGFSYFGLAGLPKWKLSFFLFQFAVAAACCSIVTGGIEERMDFVCYALLTVYMASFVYPAASHWTWARTGWLSAFKDVSPYLKTGMPDFAGCGAVHMIGGFSALIGAKMLGPRIGRFDASGKTQSLHGHNAAMTCTGVLLLWVGWFGFNPGSALAIVSNSDMIGTAAVNTNMAAVFGTLSSLITLAVMEYMQSGEVVWDLEGCGNGCLAGLVSITACASFVDTWAACVTGCVAGILYCLSSYFVLNVLKIDDPLDAASVHGANGMLGLLAASAFATKSGLEDVYGGKAITTVPGASGFLVGGDARLLMCAVTGILVMIAWVVVTIVPFFQALRVLSCFGIKARVSSEKEAVGLDIADHGGPAYHGEMPETTTHLPSEAGNIADGVTDSLLPMSRP